MAVRLENGNVDNTGRVGPSNAGDRLAREYLSVLKGVHARLDLSTEGFGSRTGWAGSDGADYRKRNQSKALDAQNVRLPAALAYAAVLTARAIEEVDCLESRLKTEAMIITIQAPVQLVGLVDRVLEFCSLGMEINQKPDGKLENGLDPPDESYASSEPVTRLMVSYIGRESEKDDARSHANAGFLRALGGDMPIIGISHDVERCLPDELFRVADAHLILPDIDEEGLALVVEAACGSLPKRKIDPTLLKLLHVADIQAALRPGTPADLGITRLRRLLIAKSAGPASDQNGPMLETLAGYGSAKDWGLELADDLLSLKQGTLTWAEIDHKAVLLAGPPGVGKTMFASALANSARVPLITTSVAEWNSGKHLSGALQAMRKSFDKAKASAPSILFIDEIDGISDRGKLRGHYDEYWSQIVNLLLELMSDAKRREGVVVIGATNFPDRIDPALRRAGRLDRMIVIPKPDIEGIEAILRHHLNGDLPSADFSKLAIALLGSTGADIESLVRRARGLARRKGRELAFDDLDSIVGSERPALARQVSRSIAIHEAGHAVVASRLGMAVVDMTINAAGGLTNIEDFIPVSPTRGQIENCLTVLMAGMAAEQLITGEFIANGVGEACDLAKATRLARTLEMQFGMGGLGFVYLDDTQAERMAISPAALSAIDGHLKAAFERASEIVRHDTAVLHKLADALMTNGRLSKADIGDLLAGDGSGDQQSGEIEISEPRKPSLSTIPPASPAISQSDAM